MSNRKKILIGLFTLVALSFGLMLLFDRTSSAVSSESKKINMGFNACLLINADTRVVQENVEMRNRHIQMGWIDSTRQYYSKSVIDRKDTMHISTINRINFSDAVKLVKSRTEGRIMDSEVQNHRFPIYRLLGKKDHAYLCRILISQRSFKAAVLIEQHSADSLYIQKICFDPGWTDKIKACIQ